MSQKSEKNREPVSFARLRIHTCLQGHNQGSKVSLSGLGGREGEAVIFFLHTVTFLVFFQI